VHFLGKGAAGPTNLILWGQAFRLPWSAVGRAASSRPSDRAHGRVGERRLPPSLRWRKESLRLKAARQSPGYLMLGSLDAALSLERGGNELLRSKELRSFGAQNHY
jgi:hypothetical protein